MKKRIVIAGGSGFIGTAIAQNFMKNDFDVVVLSRGVTKTEGKLMYVHWDGKTFGDWTDVMHGAEILINLTGKSVNCRYTDENKRLILSSRVDATAILGKAIEKCENPPKLWINASTATIYDYSWTKAMTEMDGDIGNDFSMSVAQAWEKALFQSITPTTRKVALRISLVLGKNDGVLPVLIKLAKFGLGGYHGNGKQKFAWIHIEDVLRIIDFIHENKTMEGPINCTTSTNITNKDFMRSLRKALHVPFGIPTPSLMLRIGAVLMGTESELILKSRFVEPKKLLDSGFQFKFTNVEGALNNLINE